MVSSNWFSTALKSLAVPSLIVLLVLVALESAVRSDLLPSYLVPSPSSIVGQVWRDIHSWSGDTYVTGVESVVGFTVAAFVAFTLAMVFALVHTFEKSVFPLVVAFKCMPLVALAPILALWFGGASLLAKALLAAFICFFPIIVNLRTGLNTVDQEAVDLFRSYSASRWAVLWKLRLPSAMPYFLSGLKTASTLAVIGAVVGEFACSDRGLGYRIIEASYQGSTARMFAAVSLLMVMGLVFFGLVAVIDHWLRRILRVDRIENGVVS